MAMINLIDTLHKHSELSFFRVFCDIRRFPTVAHEGEVPDEFL